MRRVAIVGAGQAGAALAIRLRTGGFTGEIRLYGNETEPPYQRPPLSKKYLSGDWEKERLWLRPSEFWSEHNIELCLGQGVSKLDLAARSLEWGGRSCPWTELVFTTGAAPRPLPTGFEGYSNVFQLRSLADGDRLRRAFLPERRLLIVGGGYIGLETAAVAVKAGLSVQVVECAPRILERVACESTARAIRSLHAQHGVTIHEGQEVLRTEGGAALSALVLDTGKRLEGDLAVVGVGVLPNTELADGAGVLCDAGILVDQAGATSVPGVWAAGDCARFPFDGTLTRLESVQNAIDQAELVADNILGQARQYQPVPWFWSDQYDTKLQIVGLNRGYDLVVDQTSAKGRSHWYFRQNRLIAVDALNDGRAYMVGKKVLESGRQVSPDEVKRPDFDPMSLLRV